MIFDPIFDRWGLAALAGDLGLPAKNVRSWKANDSIPSEWFNAIVRAAHARDFHDVTLERLADLSERRRLLRTERAAAHLERGAA